MFSKLAGAKNKGLKVLRKLIAGVFLFNSKSGGASKSRIANMFRWWCRRFSYDAASFPVTCFDVSSLRSLCRESFRMYQGAPIHSVSFGKPQCWYWKRFPKRELHRSKGIAIFCSLVRACCLSVVTSIRE